MCDERQSHAGKSGQPPGHETGQACGFTMSLCLKSQCPLTSQLLFSHSVVSKSLQPHKLQHARLVCPPLSLRICSNSCPLSQWCHRIITFQSPYQSPNPSTACFLICETTVREPMVSTWPPPQMHPDLSRHHCAHHSSEGRPGILACPAVPSSRALSPCLLCGGTHHLLQLCRRSVSWSPHILRAVQSSQRSRFSHGDLSCS